MLESELQPAAPAETVYLKDYQKPDFLIPTINLAFDLGESTSRVTTLMKVERNGGHERDLVLHGEKLTLVGLKVDGQILSPNDYSQTEQDLTIFAVPNSFELEVVTELIPHLNTELSGLYQSSGNYCTQCEAEGFRRITYFLDRPDVLSVYTVTTKANKDSCPVLLSNGNFVESQTLEDNRHSARWHDPHPKPSYLFALVAGDLEHITDEFIKASGDRVALRIYAESHNIDKCSHAMESLKKAMRWDEDVYGREYDLEIYNVVAVDDFNMGAMENKGLNIFNSKFVLADQESATDMDFEGIESVIGHEYFHNWSGNRVTCRDWFQLSLKEGFTVFRDQEFSADMGSRAVKRIRDVQVLRNFQFKEDAGPMAHAVRPDSYQEIDNFYTVTIYEKGAEVIRMMHQIVGAQGFRRGSDLYFERFDGCAVTTEDFVACMEQANKVDLSLFRNWYTQAGTPEVTVKQHYDSAAKKLTLDITQSCPSTPNQATKQPFQIPLKLAFVNKNGEVSAEKSIELTDTKHSFEFALDYEPTVSMLRDFSAPIKLVFEQSDAELAHLAKHDNNGFVRFEAIQRMALNILLPACREQQTEPKQRDVLVNTLEYILANPPTDQAMMAELLTLPSQSNLVEQLGSNVDPEKICSVHQELSKHLADTLKPHFEALYLSLSSSSRFSIDSESMARRALRNKVLHWLAATGQADSLDHAYKQYTSANNMTERMAALVALVHNDDDRSDQALNSFYKQWQNDSLVMDKWFGIQAMQPSVATVKQVQALLSHPGFSIKNPNKVRSLLGAFAGNLNAFHADGGYELLADQIILLNGINPQVGSRLAGAYNNWRSFVPKVQKAMKNQLERISQTPGLSKNISEIVNKALA